MDDRDTNAAAWPPRKGDPVVIDGRVYVVVDVDEAGDVVAVRRASAGQQVRDRGARD